MSWQKSHGQAESAKPGVHYLRHRRYDYDPEGRQHVLADCFSDDAGEGWLSLPGGHKEDASQSRAESETTRAQRARRAYPANSTKRP